MLSDLFPQAETKYTFTAEWLIASSKASKAPLDGYQAKTLEVVFTSAEQKVPSLKPEGKEKMEGKDRLLEAGETLSLNVEGKNLEGYTVSVDLLRKAGGGKYVGTGWNENNLAVPTEDNPVLLDVPLSGQTPGSFCLMFTVKKKDSVIITMEVPYYFVLKSAE